MISHLLDKQTTQIFKQPVKETTFGSIDVPDRNWNHQIDILYLPEDSRTKTKYALNVIDVYNSLVDGRPIHDRTISLICHALDDIYDNSMNLDKPRCISVDHEFDKPEFHRWAKDNGINVSVSLVNRHRQQSHVERLNKTLGTWIHEIQTVDELKTGKPNTDWVSIYRTLIEIINKNHKKRKLREKSDDIKLTSTNNTLIAPNTEVYLKVDKDVPQTVRGERLHGTLRAADPKWISSPTYTVINYSLSPNQVPLYSIRNNKTKQIVDALYSREQLQVK